MTSSDIVDLFRHEMGDSTAPYLWADDEVYPFLDDAQTWFCRLTDGIADSRTAAVTQINVIPNTDWYDTHPSILNIRKITRDDTGQKVEMLTAEKADDRGIVFMPTVQGPVREVVLGLEMHSLRIAPMPNETVTLNLRVYRLPLVPISSIGDQALEIDSQHHTSLLLWMKKRAYGKQDTETFDRSKAQDFEVQFRAYCANAKQEQLRARRVQGNIAYGGINSGPNIFPDPNGRYSRYFY